METKEFQFKGTVLNGFLMLFVTIALFILSIVGIIYGIIFLDGGEYGGGWLLGISVILLVATIITMCGLFQLEPNEAKITTWFGKYSGTITQTGFYWINPFYSSKKLSLRARNLDAEPIKVNDKTGNPVMIGLVLVWKLKDTYKALFEVDSQTMASNPNSVGNNTKFLMRDGSDEVNKELETRIDERLAMAGIEVIEARINYLAYAPEIAAVMLRRQQATAIIAAREKIVEGAVSMVKMALDKLKDEGVVELDEERKAAMVSNLLVVLCGEDNAQPIVNTGSLYQ